MSIIKPGKLGIGSEARKRSKETALENAREVWDDYAATKKAKRKREFQKGAGDRMVPKDQPERAKDKKEELSPEDNTPVADRNDISVLEGSLGFSFEDKTLLERALTHRSALGLSERADYERLEFLGDAVLDLAVAHMLSDTHPDAREGELSKMRAALVNTQALADIARALEVGPFIKLGRGEHASGGADRASILADVMEAIIGAAYREIGFEKVFALIERIYGDSIANVTPYDPKTELQEQLHTAGSEPPSYLLEMVEGPEHAPVFVTVVIVDDEVAGRGRGQTKKDAQQEAAAIALSRMIPSGEPLQLPENQKYFISSLLLENPLVEAETT